MPYLKINTDFFVSFASCCFWKQKYNREQVAKTNLESDLEKPQK